MREDFYDMVVVGAGPGGLAAAATARGAGLRVLMIDEGGLPSGQIWRGEGTVHAEAARWVRRLEGVERWAQSRVVAAVGQCALLVETAEGARVVRWKASILATGARELLLPFPGWTLPGVFGAGGLQALVKQGMEVRGKRVVVAGTGPLLLAVADYLRGKGAEVPVVLEQASARSVWQFTMGLAGSPGKLWAGVKLRARLLGTRYAMGGYVGAVSREGAGLRVAYRVGEREERLDCDYVACGFHLVPSVELAQLLGCAMTERGFVRVDDRMRTSVAGVYAVGELTGIGGVEKALVEGQMAGHAVAGDEAAMRGMAGKHGAALRFMGRLDRAFALRAEVKGLAGDETIVCRCEDVRLGAVRGCGSGRDGKLQTRCGMGACQGRVCGAILRELMGAEWAGMQQARPPVMAARVGTLAAVAPGEA